MEDLRVNVRVDLTVGLWEKLDWKADWRVDLMKTWEWTVNLMVDRLCNLPMRDSSSISLSLELSSATWIS